MSYIYAKWHLSFEQAIGDRKQKFEVNTKRERKKERERKGERKKERKKERERESI